VTLPQALRDRRQWLVWRFESHKGEKKPRKVPYYATGGWRTEDRRHGAQGSPDDRSRLVSYDEALGHAPAPGKGGIGFAFLPDDGLAGIDLDKVIDLETGEVSALALNIIQALASYTEKSPSGAGVHIFVTTERTGAFKSFKKNELGVEVFCGAQFFTFTSEHYSGTPLEVRPISAENLRRLQKTVRQPKASSPAGPTGTAPADDDQRRAEAALVYVGADEYQQWVDVGHALKHAFGDAGFPIWDRWSSKSAKYDSTVAQKKWAMLAPDGRLKLGTVFELAKRGGWMPPRAPKKRLRENNAEPSAAHAAGPPSEEPPPEGEPGDDKRPRIEWTQGKLPECVDQAEDALLKSGTRIYQRAGFLVRVVRRDTPSVRHYKRRPPGALGIVTVDVHYLIEAFTRAARWFKWSSAKNDWVPTNAPEQAANTYIARRGHWQLPRLWSAISAPTLRPDGTVLQEPGYDSVTQSWYDPCGIEFPQIPESPTHEDAARALDVFSAAFDSFPFESKADRSVALALALTALVRRSLPSAPLGGITAPMMASGKTLLADCIAILATGVSAPAMKYADTDEEATKTMLAVLAEGDQVVLIDNVERPLQGDTLCAVLTSETYRQRLLGRTEMMSVPTTTLFLATGNHLVVQGDLRTRALLCRIDPKTEHPEHRQFEGEKRESITQQRPELVAAGLTMLRAFIATGQEVKDVCKTWGRFERWSDMVRAPLIWLGCEDPCASLKDLEKEDPERIELLRVISAWEACFGAEGYTAREAIERAASSDPLNLALREVCKDRDGTLNPKKLGHWLRSHTDRIVSYTSDPPPGQAKKPAPPKRFVRAGEKDHTLLWKVETMR
jgi:putative DNA primase/helicase